MKHDTGKVTLGVVYANNDLITSNDLGISLKITVMSPKVLILLQFPPNIWFLNDLWIMSENLLKLKFKQSKYRHWSCGIHRGRLANVMKIYISSICKKILSNFIFKSFENFQKIFSFSKIEKSENFRFCLLEI